VPEPSPSASLEGPGVRPEPDGSPPAEHPEGAAPEATAVPCPAQVDFATVRRQWGVRTPGELKRRRDELGKIPYLIDGILPAQSLGLVVGDSGLGKSPLLYQAAVCVATGVPFLGHAVHRGKVLYLDFENSVMESEEITTRLARHLGLAPADYEETLMTWNLSDCPLDWNLRKDPVINCIRQVKPALAIIDSLGSYAPEVEEKNSTAGQAYEKFRTVMRETGCSLLVIHHRKKPTGEGFESLETGSPRSWFLQTRGASSLINGSDVRIGIDELSGNTCRVKRSAAGAGNEGNGKGKRAVAVDINDSPEDRGAVLVVRGFGRVRGEIPLIYLAREIDPEDGEPLGYRQLVGVELLFNEAHEDSFRGLPNTFSFKQAKQAYGKQDQATRDFLKKCMGMGILSQPSKGVYKKAQTAE
jgi:hypothetical protein